MLYPGCQDTYGTSTNENRFQLGPRDELTASTGAWERVGSHFDASPVDDVRDHGGESDHDSFEHRLVLREADLVTPGAQYLIETWYIAANDVDIFNSMSHRTIVPSLSDSVWSFAFADAGQTLGSVLDEWVDPVSPPAGDANTVLDTGDGHVQLAVRTSMLAGPDFHYEYALMNFDFDPQISRFSIPIPAGVTVVNSTFGDGDRRR